MVAETNNEAEAPPGLPEFMKYGDTSRFIRPEMAVDNFLRSLDELDKPDLTPGKKEEIRERLGKEYEGMVSMGESMNQSVLDLLFRTHAPWPYQSRGEQYFFDGAMRDIQYTIDLDRVPQGEQAWVYRASADLEQQYANLKLLLATGGSVGGYYDVIRQLQALTAMERYHATGEDFISAFGKEDPGLSIDITDVAKEKLTGEAKEGLRKEVIRKQDDWRLWSMAIVAVAQWDCDAPPGEETFMRTTVEGSKPPVLSEKKARFIRLLFGSLNERGIDSEKFAKDEGLKEKEDPWVEYKGKKLPQKIQNWYSTDDRVQTRRSYLAKAFEILSFRFEPSREGLWDRLDTLSDDEIYEWAKYIKGNAVKRLETWKSPFKSLETRVSERVVSSTIMFDLAFMAAGHLGWHFEYKIDDKGNVVRKLESGGIYKAWDVMSGVYWALRKHRYDAEWKSATQFLPPTAHASRKEWYINRPGWAPDIHEYIGSEDRPVKDKIARAIWDFVFSPDFSRARAVFLAGKNPAQGKVEEILGEKKADLDPAISEFLRKNAWAWVTPFEDQPGSKQLLALPMFFPHTLDILNLWYYLKEKKGGPSIWENLNKEGKKLSAIEWDKTNFEPLDRYWVSMHMLFRYLRILIDPFEAEKDPSIQAFFVNISTTSEKELAKRLILTFRDFPDETIPMVASLLPYAVVQHTANKRGIFGGTQARDPEVISNFVDEIGRWIQAFKYLPNYYPDEGALEKPKFQNLGNDMAILAGAYMLWFLRIGQAASGQQVKDEQQSYDVLRDMVEGRFTGLQDILKPRNTYQPKLVVRPRAQTIQDIESPSRKL